MTFMLTVWADNGPRDRSNCMHRWGRRIVTVDAANERAAITKAVVMVAKNGQYGGLVSVAAK